jgi:hypothetical protein
MLAQRLVGLVLFSAFSFFATLFSVTPHRTQRLSTIIVTSRLSGSTEHRYPRPALLRR